MNLANACYLLKPDSQIISRLCEAAYRGRTAGGPRSTRRGGGVTSPGLPLMQLSFCWSLRHWLWVTAGVNTKSFSFLFWVHRPNSFLLQLPGLGPSCWLILPGFRQPSFTLQAAGFIPPASPNRPPHWTASGGARPEARLHTSQSLVNEFFFPAGKTPG